MKDYLRAKIRVHLVRETILQMSETQLTSAYMEKGVRQFWMG